MAETPRWLQDARNHWTNRGQERPPFAIAPAAGEESVWDYPRPPAIVDDQRRVDVLTSAGTTIASTQSARRVLETASPPTFYIRPEDVDEDLLVSAAGSSFCEWKGPASYVAVLGGAPETVGWSYPTPFAPFDVIAGWYSFYPGRLVCRVDGVSVTAQEGGFYGGWVTPEIVGPWKGQTGTGQW